MSPTADWRTRAEAALLLAPDQLDRAEASLAQLPAEQQARARSLVRAVVGQAPGLDGFVAALAALEEGLPDVAPEPFKGMDPPAISAVKLASLSGLQGLAVLTGRVIAAGPASQAQARALLAAIDGAELFTRGQRSVLRSEARQGLGDDLYVQALQP